MNNYTYNMDNSLFSREELDNEDSDYRSTIEFLNSSNFRSFGEGILSIVSHKYPIVTSENILHFVTQRYADSGVPIPAANTLRNWLVNKGERPKKGADSRLKMFRFSFAMSFNTSETAELFHKVYLDRAFDYRNPEELIYYYCLEHEYSYAYAQNLISQISFNESDNYDKTIYTSAIVNELANIDSDIKLLEYIANHKHNFSLKDIRAKNELEYYLSSAHEDAKKEVQVWDDKYKGMDRDSNNFLYEVITDCKASNGKGTITVFKNVDLPKEIRTCFPEVATFSKKNRTYEEDRKLLILIFSYDFWYKLQNEKVNIDDADIYDEYRSQLDALLSECGLSTMYAGNPFDWLFLYCAFAKNPLDVFRSILSDALANY